jgi:hypothetical protein
MTNLFENCLKVVLAKLPFQRMLIYLIILGLLPSAASALYYTQKKREWDTICQQLQAVHSLSLSKARKQYGNMIVRNAYSEVDQTYLENHLESFSFLKKERETLEQLLQNPTFTGNESAEKRYAFLTSHANRLEFMPANPEVGDGIQESHFWLSHPVEMDAHDLKEILTRIEGNRKGKPQLLITDFKFNKKTLLSGNEVLEVNLKLLKREFHS